MTILVVDDSRIQRNIIRASLQEHFGHSVKIFEAPNGLSAESMLPTLKPNLLLLDWNMPELNGLDLIKKIRKKEEYKSLPVIMITSESAKYNVIEAVKAGVNDYLVKPVSSPNLISKIKRLNLGA